MWCVGQWLLCLGERGILQVKSLKCSSLGNRFYSGAVGATVDVGAGHRRTMKRVVL